MQKLEEIKQEIAEYDQAIKELHALPYAIQIDSPTREYEKREAIRSRYWHAKDKVDAQMEHWFRALLPIAEAAAKLNPFDLYDAESMCCVSCNGEAIYANSLEGKLVINHVDDCPVKQLFDALTLPQTSPEPTGDAK